MRTKEKILKTVDEDELFCLFETFLTRLIEKNSREFHTTYPIVFLDRHKFQVIKEMKKDYA